MLKLHYHKNLLEAGCDEAGRGCLCGPVFAAAVILPEDYKNSILDDSKKLTEKQRDLLRIDIEKNALAWAVAQASSEEIDEINILNASILAMHRAVTLLHKTPAFLLIDGNRFHPYHDIPHLCIVKGDGKYMPIAAASVLAKTHRDEYMVALHKEFPEYGWLQNKGYPTAYHRQAIRSSGLTPHHRKSFNSGEQLKIDF